MAVAPQQQPVVAQPYAAAAAQYLCNRQIDRRAAVLVDEVQHSGQGLALGGGETPTAEAFGDRVHQADAALGVGRHDGVADRVQRRRQRLLAGRQRAPAGFVGAQLAPNEPEGGQQQGGDQQREQGVGIGVDRLGAVMLGLVRAQQALLVGLHRIQQFRQAYPSLEHRCVVTVAARRQFTRAQAQFDDALRHGAPLIEQLADLMPDLLLCGIALRQFPQPLECLATVHPMDVEVGAAASGHP